MWMGLAYWSTYFKLREKKVSDKILWNIWVNKKFLCLELEVLFVKEVVLIQENIYISSLILKVVFFRNIKNIVWGKEKKIS